MKRIISPSMLSADFGHLERDTKMIDRSAAEWVHIDVMDGVFVPNISFGFPVIRAIRAATAKFLDVHLMIVEPDRYVARFVEAGAQLVTVHAEAALDVRATLEHIRSCGALAGLSIKPATPVAAIEEFFDVADLVLVMSVEPGFGGQSFMPVSLDKVGQLRAAGYKGLIEIDGGIGAGNAALAFAAGCDVLVAGNAVFGAADPEAEIAKMLEAGNVNMTKPF
jgi:ribulose-phosphate 3-epimerase